MSVKAQAIIRILQTSSGLNILNSLRAAGITGTSGADTLAGTGGDDLISGGAGSDTLYGGDGNDTLNGGADDDFLYGDSGEDILIGDIGDDTLDGGTGSDRLIGNSGNDIYYTDGFDIIIEQINEGLDKVIITGPVTRYALEANVENLENRYGLDFQGIGNELANSLWGGSANDRLEGRSGDDVLIGGPGDDYLEGGTGNDLLSGGSGMNLLSGGLGDDIYVVSEESDAIVELYGEGNDSVRTVCSYYILPDFVENVQYIGLDNVFLGIGNNLDNIIQSNSELNFLDGGGGNDRLIGGNGTDYLTGGDGDDFIDGKLGEDTIVYQDNAYSVDVNLERGTAISQSGIDTFIGIEDIFGSMHSDILVGNSGSNYIVGSDGDDFIEGLEGNDVLAGESGDDQVIGGDGNDFIYAGYDNDILYGGSGIDTVSYRGIFTNSRMSIDLFTGVTHKILAENIVKEDQISKIENVIGSDDNDQITGDLYSNELDGGIGDDLLKGMEGDDTLIGGSGNDQIDGGTGKDVMQGGIGDDTYVMDSPYDQITELAGEGIDTVIVRFTEYRIPDNFENISYDNTLNGVNFFGNQLDNVIIGGKFDDVFTVGVGSDDIQGGEGDDTAIFIEALYGADIDLSLSKVIIENDVSKLTDIENIYGTNFDDKIVGDFFKNLLSGLDGNDSIDGGNGDDIIHGGDGNDTFTDWRGNNILIGGNGKDTVSYESFFYGLLRSPTITINLANGISIIESDSTLPTTGGSPPEKINYSINQLSEIENAIGSNISDSITGDSDSNNILGLGGNDYIVGGLGDDLIDGGHGSDVVSYEYLTNQQKISASLLKESVIVVDEGGNQLTVDVLVNIENLIGGKGDDSLTGDNGNNSLNGSNGSDNLYGKGGDDILIGGTGSNHLDGGDGNDTADYQTCSLSINANLTEMFIKFGDHTDTVISIENINGSSFDDILIGTDGANLIAGGNGDDRLIGKSGNDVLIDGSGSNEFNGGDGHDTVSFAPSETGVRVSMVQNTASSIVVDGLRPHYISHLFSIEDLIGSSFDDEFEGNDSNNNMDGGAGNDTIIYSYLISGRAIEANLENGQVSVFDEAERKSSFTYPVYEADTLTSIENVFGSNGSDILIGNAEDNILDGRYGADVLRGGGGNDKIYAKLGEDILIDGGDGSDTLILPNEPINSKLTKIFRLDGTSGFINFENLASGSGNDMVLGDTNDNWIDGGLGNDLIRGGGGNDYLKDSGGVNLLYGNAGHNVIESSGVITSTDVTFAAYSWAESLTIDLRLANGNARLTTPENSTFSFVDDYIGISAVNSGSGNDIISGDDANNFLFGNNGNDTINGAGGNDQIVGGAGNDILSGGEGNDHLKDGAGFDILQGGQGADRFIFGPSNTGGIGSPYVVETDTIIGFESGTEEKISLRDFGVLPEGSIEISNSVGQSTITISLAHELRTIIIENPSGAITSNDLMLLGSGSAPPETFDIGAYFSTGFLVGI